MGYTTIMGALGALEDDERWRGPLTPSERRLCMDMAERKMQAALELAFTGVRARLVSAAVTLPHVPEDERLDVLKSMLE